MPPFFPKKPLSWSRLSLIMGIVWTMVFAASLSWNWYDVDKRLRTLAESEARSFHPEDSAPLAAYYLAASQQCFDMMLGYAVVWMIGLAFLWVGIAAIRRDRITLERQNETLRESGERLSRSERDLKTILNNIPSAIGYWDNDLRNRFGNRAYSDWLGITLADMPGMHMAAVIGEERYRLNRPLVEAALTGKHQLFERVFPSPDGLSTRHSLTHYIPDISGGEVQGVYVVISDVTPLKLAEHQLRDSEARLRQALEAANAGIWEWDLKTNENFCSDELYKLYDLNPDTDKPFYEGWRQTIVPEQRKEIEQAANDAAAGGHELNIEWRVNTSDGSLRWLMSRGKPQRDASGRVTKYIGTVIDITRLKRVEDALRRSEERLNFVLQVSHTGGWELNITDHTIYRNLAHAHIFGYDSSFPVWTHERFMEHVFPEDRAGVDERLQQAVADQTDLNFECRIRRVDGEVRWIWVAGGHFHDTATQTDRMAGIVQDITARKTVEKEKEALREQYTQAQKMESVGRLAGGVAHDFNNMLGVILGYAEFALDQIDPDESLFTPLQEIRKAAEHSAHLTRQLLAFARKQAAVPEVLDLNEIVESILKILRRLIGENIDFAWLPGKNLGRIKMDPAQVDQILANLCVNARDAIENTGRVTIETSGVTVDKAGSNHPSLRIPPGKYVLLTVSDDGHGMDKETLTNIFEPFFTTKERGKGTGLGLSTVYGIVRQNNGFIDVESEAGRGTAFRIYLPLLVENDLSAPPQNAPEPITGGHETVLLVEDDVLVLKMTAFMLDRLGYAVLAAEAPGEGIRLAEEHIGPIHLVITDVIMPEMNGRDLTRKLLSLRPDLKCLFISGYTADVIARHGVLEEGVQLIKKPFSKKDLASKIRSVLA